MFAETPFAGREFAGPGTDGARASVHGGEEMRPGIEREGHETVGIRNVVLESASTCRFEIRGLISMDMAPEITFAIAADAYPQDQIVHATADIDRIDLNVAVVREGVCDVGDGFVEQQRSAKEASSGLPGDSQEGTQAVGLSGDARKKQASVPVGLTGFWRGRLRACRATFVVRF